jgi:hypothetical protein
MEKEAYHEMIKESYGPAIMLLSDGKHSIQDIAKELELAYTTIFYKVKEYETKGLLKIDPAKSVGGKSFPIRLVEEIKGEANTDLKRFNYGEKLLKETINNPKTLKILIDVLKELSKKRYMNILEYFALIDKVSRLKDDNGVSDYLLNELSTHTGIIKHQIELGKRGKDLLRKHKISSV